MGQENKGSAEHEEGPWFLDPVDTCEWQVLGPSNGFCANVIATIHSTDMPQGAANARLIAAAPDLLEALALYVAACGNTAASVDRELVQEAWRRANAAIAKARGQ